MKTGLSETSVFAVFHPDASDLFNVCSSLEKVNIIIELLVLLFYMCCGVTM